MKYNLQIQEKAVFDHEITIEIPDEMDIDELLDIVEEEAKHSNFSDFIYLLGKPGRAKVLETCESDGDTESIECVGYDEID